MVFVQIKNVQIINSIIYIAVKLLIVHHQLSFKMENVHLEEVINVNLDILGMELNVCLHRYTVLMVQLGLI
jgi:hypothetical protein